MYHFYGTYFLFKRKEFNLLFMKVIHKIPPIYTENSKILILGTIPSPKSRENSIFYGNPQNRFWKVLSQILKEPFPNTNEDKISIAKKYNIAIWDVLYSCDIEGASDNTIKNPVPNNLNKIINQSQIKYIFTTGTKAFQLYNKYCFNDTKIEAVLLPSTSPANFRYSTEKLCLEYSIILNYI